MWCHLIVGANLAHKPTMPIVIPDTCTMGSTLASAINYRSDGILGLMRLFTSSWNCLFNYCSMDHIYCYPLCTLTIYEKVVFVRHIHYFKKSSLKHKFATHHFAFVPKKQIHHRIMSHEWFVNTTAVAMIALHTRNAMTEGSHFGRGAHFTHLSPTVIPTGNVEHGSVLQYAKHHCQSTTMTWVLICCCSIWTIMFTCSVVFKCLLDCRQWWT